MYLGLDAGTSEIKGVVIDENGSLLASAGEPLTVQRPHPHWSEQDPADWIAAALQGQAPKPGVKIQKEKAAGGATA